MNAKSESVILLYLECPPDAKGNHLLFELIGVFDRFSEAQEIMDDHRKRGSVVFGIEADPFELPEVPVMFLTVAEVRCLLVEHAEQTYEHIYFGEN